MGGADAEQKNGLGLLRLGPIGAHHDAGRAAIGDEAAIAAGVGIADDAGV